MCSKVSIFEEYLQKSLLEVLFKKKQYLSSCRSWTCSHQLKVLNVLTDDFKATVYRVFLKSLCKMIGQTSATKI